MTLKCLAMLKELMTRKIALRLMLPAHILSKSTVRARLFLVSDFTLLKNTWLQFHLLNTLRHMRTV